MYRLLVILLAAAIAFTSATAQAQSVQPYDLPGEDDPRLQRAIDAWLDGEGLGPVTELAALARDGNVAARLLLWKLESRGYTDLPDLSREDRYRLYRAPSERRIPRRWADTEEMRALPFLVDWYKVAKEKDPHVWLHHARGMLAAGEREHVLQSSAWRLQIYPYLAEFVGEITTVDDYHQVEVWFARWLTHFGAESGLSAREDRLEGWTGPPWTAEHEAALRRAFGERRVAALRFLRIRNMMSTERLPGNYLVDRTHDRSVELWDWYKSFIEMEPPTPVERRTAGALLVAEARHGGYLAPLLDICETQCGQTLETCMYSGVLHAGGLAFFDQLRSPLEAVISQDRWRKSFRVRRDLLSGVRAIQEKQAVLRAQGKAAFRPPSGGCFAQLLEN